MKLIPTWAKTNSPGNRTGKSELGIPSIAMLLLATLCGSALISGTVVLAISRFGGGSGLPQLGFRGALSISLLGSWFSLGAAGTREQSSADLKRFMVETLSHQLGCALLMLLLLGILHLVFGWTA